MTRLLKNREIGKVLASRQGTINGAIPKRTIENYNRSVRNIASAGLLRQFEKQPGSGSMKLYTDGAVFRAHMILASGLNVVQAEDLLDQIYDNPEFHDQLEYSAPNPHAPLIYAVLGMDGQRIGDVNIVEDADIADAIGVASAWRGIRVIPLSLFFTDLRGKNFETILALPETDKD